MSPVPAKVRLFHITAIANLPAILASGALLAKNVLAAQNQNYANIAHEHIQGRRAAKAVALPPHGTLHDLCRSILRPVRPC